jgi:O-acetyl-ADP-ribose deacetylase
MKNGTTVRLERGDLTTWRGDAIVNAANEQMLGGGGVDGAIHRAAGPELLQACLEIPPVRPHIRCPTGEARITLAFGALHCRYVIHTVGPVYTKQVSSEPLLSGAYRSCLELANEHDLHTIAFPAISCGVFGYPLAEAAPIALAACENHAGTVASISFVLFTSAAYTAWEQALSRPAP